MHIIPLVCTIQFQSLHIMAIWYDRLEGFFYLRCWGCIRFFPKYKHLTVIWIAAHSMSNQESGLRKWICLHISILFLFFKNKCILSYQGPLSNINMKNKPLQFSLTYVKLNMKIPMLNRNFKNISYELLNLCLTEC